MTWEFVLLRRNIQSWGQQTITETLVKISFLKPLVISLDIMKISNKGDYEAQMR